MPEDAAVAARLSAWQARGEVALTAALDNVSIDTGTAGPGVSRLQAAMRHAVLGGGKRMRPLLVYASGALFDVEAPRLDAPAVAVELIHAYSLVHDDLPAMDDDRLRRGKPTVHAAFDEATAILAGDALQSLAFAALVEADFDADIRIDMLRTLAHAAGASGMCGGQALDLQLTGSMDGNATHTFDPGQLERLHRLKTGALLRASVRLGALAGSADADALQRLDRFADALGLAFQIRDDLLDVEGDSATLGKTAGKDAAQAKATFPGMLGVEASRLRLRELAEDMRQALEAFGDPAQPLAVLGRRAIEREA